MQQTIEFKPFNCPICHQVTDLEPEYLPKNLDLKKKVEDYINGRQAPALPVLTVDSSTLPPRKPVPKAPSPAPTSSYSSSSSSSSYSSSPSFSSGAPQTQQTSQPGFKKQISIVGRYAPAHLSPEQAGVEVQKWIEARWFAPSQFSSKVKIVKMTPLYIPFYVFKTHVSTRYFAEALVVSAASLNVVSQDQSAKDWEKVSGQHEETHNNILLCSAKNPLILGYAEQFKTEDWEPFAANLPLSDFPSGIEFDESEEWMGLWMKQSEKLKEGEREGAKKELEAKGWKVRGLKVLTTFGDLEKQLIYLPVYIGIYIYESNEYKVTINAQKGGVMGERPYGLGSSVEVAKSVGQKGLDYFEDWRRG